VGLLPNPSTYRFLQFWVFFSLLFLVWVFFTRRVVADTAGALRSWVYDTQEAAQVLQLSSVVRTGSTQSPAPEVLFATRLQKGQQGRQSAALACLGQGARLLSRLGQCAAGAGMA